MLNLSKIRAISLDLDDTLWPVWPTIERAERVLLQWLGTHAPQTAALFGSTAALREIRQQVETMRPDLHFDLSALRRESIRLALQRAGDDDERAEEAFEVFFAERQRVDFYPDAMAALEFLAARFPLVALSNGNADVHRVGIGHLFTAAISAREFGAAKPDPRIFIAAAGALQVDPAEVLHIGDDPLLDVVGAVNAGMQAGWVNRGEHVWSHEIQPHLHMADLDALCLLFDSSYKK
ncbi:HAD family hydrolase [Rhodoferax sp.]|uniref:HAD family hydrolase n=1 Tax=Rhodoferax sp. TaxID=50421 RepID=UPI00374D5896